MTFNPAGNEEVHLSGYTFRVRAHGGPGAVASRPIRVVGGRAQVYQLIEAETGDTYALKVMLPAFRKPQLLRNGGLLKQLAPNPGFEACRQTYITPQTHPQEIARYSDLEYASLMPWIQGQDWKAIIGNPEATMDADTTWELAYQLIRLVRMLERNQIAHCDLSGGNVMVNLDSRRVTLIDFDEVYWQGAPTPAALPTGTPGYRRRVESQWTEASDRFPMAVLIAEMLGWRDSAVRRIASGDSYFTDEDCLGVHSEKYHLLEVFMRNLRPELGELLQRAWLAPSHAECPTPDEWRAAIIRARGWRTTPLDPLDHARVDLSVLPRASFTPSVSTPAPTRTRTPAPVPPGPQGSGLVAPTPMADQRLVSVPFPSISNQKPNSPKTKDLNAAPKPPGRRKQSGSRRKFDLGNLVVIGIVVLSILALSVGLLFLIFRAR